jgi:hypothetical protein
VRQQRARVRAHGAAADNDDGYKRRFLIIVVISVVIIIIIIIVVPMGWCRGQGSTPEQGMERRGRPASWK